MSLLLDARKKAELALQESSRNKTPGLELSLEDVALHSSADSSEFSSAGTAIPAADTPPVSPAPYMANQRAAGQNLFKAKASPRARLHLGIIPIALIGGVILAAAGGLYVWHEISPPTPAPPAHVTPPTPIAPAAPAPAAVMSKIEPAEDQPVVAAPPDQPIASQRPHRAHKKPSAKKKVGSQRLAAPATPIAESTSAEAANAEADDPHAIKILHGLTSAAIDPALPVAYQAYQNGDLITAGQRYREVLQHDASNRDALLGLAAIAQQQRQDAIAINYYRQVLDLNPRDPVALAGISSLPSGVDATATESRLKTLLAQQPQTPDAHTAALHFVLGNLYAAQSRWGNAQQSYFNAYNLDPGNAQIAFNLAISLDHLQQGRLAAQYYQRALQLDAANSAGFDHVQAQQRINELATR